MTDALIETEGATQDAKNSAAPGDIVEGDGQTIERVIRVLCRELLAGTHPTYTTLRDTITAIRGFYSSAIEQTIVREQATKEMRGTAPAPQNLFKPPTALELFLDRIPMDVLQAPAALELLEVCVDLAVFLMGKNLAYGDSALKPLRAISKADPTEQIRVRMDDKLSRIVRGEAAGEDALKDLVGYWVLLQVLERRNTGA
jgi:hypothetical protein